VTVPKVGTEVGTEVGKAKEACWNGKVARSDPNWGESCREGERNGWSGRLFKGTRGRASWPADRH